HHDHPHLHSFPTRRSSDLTRNDASAKVLAAWDAGCRRIDSAIGGLGGCPLAQDALVGNIPTENVIEALRQRDVELPIGKSLANVDRKSTRLNSSHDQISYA